MNKEEWIARHGLFRYHDLDISEMDLRMYGDTAVVRDVQRNYATWQDNEVRVNTRVSHVWIRRQEGWQIVAIQFSPLAEA